jgi:hypothetical protein
MREINHLRRYRSFSLSDLSIPSGLNHSARGWTDSERAYPGTNRKGFPTPKGLHQTEDQKDPTFIREINHLRRFLILNPLSPAPRAPRLLLCPKQCGFIRRSRARSPFFFANPHSAIRTPQFNNRPSRIKFWFDLVRLGLTRLDSLDARPANRQYLPTSRERQRISRQRLGVQPARLEGPLPLCLWTCRPRAFRFNCQRTCPRCHADSAPVSLQF